MQFAVKDNQREKAFKGAKGFQCPGCRGDVVPRCGTKYIHHWAHAVDGDCDTWSEPESEWHLSWKNYFPKEWLEVVMGDNREHRADILRPDSLVIELQHSIISFPEAKERCEFYGDIIWIFDAHGYINRCSLLCWYGEYPPRWYSEGSPNKWFGIGRKTPNLTLSNPDKIWNQNSVFHSTDNKHSLSISVPMTEAPESGPGVTQAMKNKQARIKHCKERLSFFANNHRKVSKWSLNLENAEKELAGPDPATCFLIEPVPANSEELICVNVAGVEIFGVPLRIRWSRPRQAFLELECSFLWDFDENYILFFSAIRSARSTERFIDCVLLKKTTVIEALRGSPLRAT